MKRLRVALIAVLAAALAACGSSDDDGDAGATVPAVSNTGASQPPEPTEPSVPAATVSPTPELSATSLAPISAPPPSRPGTSIDPTLPLVVGAVEDLAQRLGIASDAVTVVDARAVTWPDGSLGCPEPGMLYTQVLVDGALVVLEADGRRYEYHGGDPLFLCEHPK